MKAEHPILDSVYKLQLSEYLTYLRHLGSQLMFITISSSTFTALKFSMFVFMSFIFQGFKPDFWLIAATFTITFSIYNMDRLTGVKEDNLNDPKRLNFFRQRKKLWMFIIISSFSATYLIAAQRGSLAILIISIPLIAGLLYSIKLPFMTRLKEISGIKNFYVAGFITLYSILIPLSVKGNVSAALPFITLFYFFFIYHFIVSVLLDVRDTEGDNVAGIKTLPIILGEKRLLKLLLFLNSTLIIWLATSWFLGYFKIYLWAIIFTIVYGFLYIKFLSRRRTNRGSLDLMIDLGGSVALISIIILILNLGT